MANNGYRTQNAEKDTVRKPSAAFALGHLITEMVSNPKIWKLNIKQLLYMDAVIDGCFIPSRKEWGFIKHKIEVAKNALDPKKYQVTERKAQVELPSFDSFDPNAATVSPATGQVAPD
jgi:hypothetical protein